jgi:hypothetical protein
MFGMALEGLGINTIAGVLNRESVPAKTGGHWHTRTVSNVLRNKSYTGLTTYGKQVTKLLAQGKRSITLRDSDEVLLIDGFTPAIVDSPTFGRVQAHLDRPRRSGKALEPYLLSGLLRCTCGTGLVGQSMQRGRFRYYTCRATSATATRPRTCFAHRNRAGTLDNRVWNAISGALMDPDFLFDRVTAQRLSSEDPPEVDIAQIKADLKRLSGEENSLLAALRKAPSAANSIAVELEKIARERKQLERAINTDVAAREHSSDTQVTRESVRLFAGAVGQRLKTLDTVERRELLSVLGFEASVGDSGTILASIAVPSISTALFTTGRTWA